MRNKKLSEIAIFLVTFIFTLSFAYLTSAQVQIPQVPGQASGAFGGGQQTIRQIIVNILTLALQIAGFLAILFVIYGGFRYMTSGGSEEGAEAGKKILTNAIIGLAVIILSYVILAVISNALAGTV